MATAALTYDDLYPFQKEGVKFLLDRPAELNYKPHRLLADVMGLGKTPQACVALVQAAVESALIICPAPLKETWQKQLVAWGVCPLKDTHIVWKTNDSIPDKPFIIVNYDLLPEIVRKKKEEEPTSSWSQAKKRRTKNHGSAVFKQLMRRWFKAIILDEVQRLKSLFSTRSRLILGKWGPLCARAFMKFALSGTVMPNSPIELYPLTYAWAPECLRPYDSLEAFGKRFCSGFFDRQRKSYDYSGASNIDELSRRLVPFMLRREMAEVYPELPPAVQETVYIGQTLPDTYNVHTLPVATLRKAVGDSKTPQVIEYLRDRLTATGEKITVFAYTRTVVEDLTEALSDFGAVNVYGGITTRQKTDAVNKFIEDPACKVLVAQINSAGEGIDGLQHVCRRVVFAEPDWTPGLVDQAIARLVRIGQKLLVYVTRLVSEKTFDETMIRVFKRKERVIDEFFENVREISKQSKEIFTMSLEQELSGIKGAIEKLNISFENFFLNFQSNGTPAVKEEAKKETAAEKQEAAEKTETEAEAEKPADKPEKAGKANGKASSKPEKQTVNTKSKTLTECKDLAAAKFNQHVEAYCQALGKPITDRDALAEARPIVQAVFQGICSRFGGKALAEIDAQYYNDVYKLLEESQVDLPEPAAAGPGI